jgi:diacylglycerol kinase (ATP)
MESRHTFDAVDIIFNPNSTGEAPEMARTLHDRLTEILSYSPDLRLVPTEHAGHAITLAREAAQRTTKALVVSVSGDGGYNEVVNGVMESGNPSAVCAVMGAGNANDHRRTTATKPLAEAIAEGDVRHIDLLRVTVGEGEDSEMSYAHSYVGFGLTPVMAIDLEKGSKGALKEMVSVIKTFSKFRPFEILTTDGRRRRFDSMLFANIAEMAKYATLSEAGNEAADGMFEVIVFPHVAKWRILLLAIRAATKGLGDQPSVHNYEFTAVKPIPYQMDGEVKSLPARTRFLIESAPAALSTLG